MVVVMIDIAGYSAMTSALTTLGKISSELITTTVGTFMGRIINVVEQFGGDIVKFLGDAILVTFSATLNQQQAHESIISRALACSSEILQNHSKVMLPRLAHGEYETRRTSINMSSSKRGQYESGSTNSEMSLSVHIAVVGGDMNRVILGDINERLDYSVSGDCMSRLGPILDKTKPGEIGVDKDLWSSIATPSEATADLPFIKFSMETLHILNTVCKPVNLTSQHIRLPSIQVNLTHEREETQRRILSKFINQSMARRILADSDARRRSFDPPKQNMSVNPPEDDHSLGQLESRQQNLSRITEDTTKRKWSRLTAGEFRILTIAFIKFNGSFDSRLSQLAISGEPEYAIPAMMDFLTFASKNNMAPVSMGLATGEILVSVLGHESRCEVSFLGDIVNIGARFVGLNIAPNSLIVDDSTHLAGEALYEHIGLGTHKLKGKAEPQNLWKIANTNFESSGPSEEIYGYENEREWMKTMFKKWKEENAKADIFVEAPSGLGKSKLGKYFANCAIAENVPIFLTQGSELEQGTPYFGIQGVMAQIYADFVNLPSELKVIPIKSNQQSPSPGKIQGSQPSLSIRGAYRSHEGYASNKTYLGSINTIETTSHENRPPLLQKISLTSLGTSNGNISLEANNEHKPDRDAYPSLPRRKSIQQSMASLFYKDRTADVSKVDDSPSILQEHVQKNEIIPTGERRPSLLRRNSLQQSGDTTSVLSTKGRNASSNEGKVQESRSDMSHRVSIQSSGDTLSLPPTHMMENRFESRFRDSRSNITGTTPLHLVPGEPELFMKYYNEDCEMAPLLGLLLPSITVKETEKSLGLDQQAKGNLVRSLILRIFKSFVAKQKFVFIFDDAQWLDELSLEIILSLIKFSTKECILLLSRPVKDSGSDTLKTIFNHIHVERIQLGGLNLSAIEQMIIKKLSDSRYKVTSIEPRLLKGIFEKGSGFPLYTDIMSDALREKVNVDFQIDSSGCLKIADISKSANDVLLDNVGTAVMSHFDKLDPDFQEYFNLIDLCTISRTDLAVEDMKFIIQTKDRYNFIQLEERVAGEGENSQLSSDKVSCSFRHIAIMNAIYDSLPFSTRSKVNETAAQYFENLMLESNSDALLPWICFYYSRSESTEKAIQYLEQLALIYVKNCTYAEAIKTFDKLLAIINCGDYLSNIETLRLGNWYSNYGYASVMRMNGTVSLKYAIEAIGTVDRPWPTEEKGLKKRFMKAILRFLVLWYRTRGGTRPLYNQKKISSVDLQITNQVTREHILEQALITIYLGFVFNADISPSAVGLALMELSCMVILRAHRDVAFWKLTLARCSLAFHYSLTPLAKLTFKKALEIENVGEQAQAHHFILAALRMFVRPHLSVSLKLLESYAE
ncbi:hypothetical protein HDU76_013093 [Blyttiomyces sp. JEL0837]|nr:hypothetical protein HDU76_013093 [Blyttiomyces sp. JEL0837]